MKKYLLALLLVFTNCMAETFFDRSGACIANFWQDDWIHIFGKIQSELSVDQFFVKVQENEFSVLADLKEGSFSFVIPAQDKNFVKDLLISVTPVAGEQQGYPFYCLLNSSIPMPPQAEIDLVGDGDFLDVSAHVFGILKDSCGLKATDSILEVGCGLGRIAYALACYLEPQGSYKGFDVTASLIQRAQLNITPLFPEFQFSYADIYNGLYNPYGTILASQFRFPYADNQFDFIYLTSVFTHMRPEDIKHYLTEIKRVLKPGGKCMATAFLQNESSRQLFQENPLRLGFSYPFNEAMIVSPQIPEAVISYEEGLMLFWIIGNGFQVERMHYGSWCGRKGCLSFQDVILFSK